MAIQQKLQTRLAQKLILTPSLQQAIKLLPMSTLELADLLNQEVVVTACIGLGFTIEHPRGHRIFAIELGNAALVDGLPGVPGGSSYVGSFDREEAVENEMIDFFASGHPLGEGIFAHYEDSALGRVVRFEIEIGDEPGEGLVALYPTWL